MELIAEILTNPTTGALDADWPVQSDDVRASQRRIEPRFPTKRLTAIYSTGSGGSKWQALGGRYLPDAILSVNLAQQK